MSETPSFPAGMQKPVCVFCGSSPGKLPIFVKAAEAVGAAMADAKIPLVYGGGRRGLMGTVSKGALDAGGLAHGIVPGALVGRASQAVNTPTAATAALETGSPDVPSGKAAQSKEGSGKDLLADDYDGRLTMEVTGTMHERKMKMAQMSTGGFITLPGGYGTFEEVLEMITWNQLGIHSVPVIILNINNVYTPLRALFETSVESGFIAPENLSLMRIIDLPGGESANADESKAAGWGAVAVQALKEWKVKDGAGYGLQWSTDKDMPTSSSPSQAPGAKGSPSPDFNLFTTLRYTSFDMTRASLPIGKEDLPLVDRHIARLREAHSHFAKRDGLEMWGTWPGDEAVWHELRRAVEAKETAERGDWRVRLVLHQGARIEVQMLPAPAGIPPFSLRFPPSLSPAIRPLVLDPLDADLASESPESHDHRLYKTSHRKIYDDAAARGGREHPEVLLHTRTHVLETCASNIALHLPGRPGEPEWVTPRLREGEALFLNGVVRRELLDQGLVREDDVTIEDCKRCVREGRPIIGFNGLRGVWHAAVKV